MIVTLINQKEANQGESYVLGLGSALKARGQNVLLIDMDPQTGFSRSSQAMTVPTIAEALEGKCDIDECFQSQNGMTTIACDSSLVKTEFEMIKSSERFLSMRKALHSALGFDFVIIDCTPLHALLALNALVTSSHMLVALPMSVTALRDLDSLLFTIENIRPYNTKLNMLGILPIVSAGGGLIENIREYINTNYSIKVFERFATQGDGTEKSKLDKFDWLAEEMIVVSRSIQLAHPN